MLIGKLENGNRTLEFENYAKEVTKKQYEELLKGKTNALTEEEYQQFHYNIEAKRTSDPVALMEINKEILKTK